ncbi:MAG: hypothetical protein CM15mP92_1560 [Halieaceae bacterium]|nr:MAG: hypothetical protein CM15mP92_1560 [Halieaceae bacterium]
METLKDRGERSTGVWWANRPARANSAISSKTGAGFTQRTISDSR